MGVYSTTVANAYADKIKLVYEHLDEIRKVADRLTPVEDLEGFRTQIGELHSYLDLLVEASNIIVTATSTGEAILTGSVASIQKLLGIGEFPDDYVTHAELEAALAALRAELLAQINSLGGNLSNINIQMEELENYRIYQQAQLTGLQQNYQNVAAGLETNQSNTELVLTRLTVQEENATLVDQRLDSINQNLLSTVNGLQAANEILSGHTATIDMQDDKIALHTASIDQLSSNLLDVNSGLQVNTDALSLMETSILGMGEDLVAQSQQTTALKAVIGGSGNLLPNADFAAGANGWSIVVAEEDWASTVLTTNTFVEMPDDVHCLEVLGDPSPLGQIVVQSPPILVEEGKHYMLSGYPCVDNGTVALSYKTFDAANNVLDQGVCPATFNVTTNPNFNQYTRTWVQLLAGTGAVKLRVYLTVTGDGDWYTRGALFRPMVENSWAEQEAPSAWTPNIMGVPEALAEATNVLRAEVSRIDGDLTAVAEDTTTLKTDVYDSTTGLSSKASNTRVATAESRLDTLTGDLSSVAQTVTSLEVSTGVMSGNLCPNPTAEFDTSGWVVRAGGSGPVVFDRNYAPIYTVNPGTFYLRQTDGTSGGYRDVGLDSSTLIPVVPGARYCIQSRAATHRCSARLFAYYYDAPDEATSSGNSYGQFSNDTNNIAVGEAQGGTNLSGYKLLSQFVTIPAGVNYMMVTFRKFGTNAGASPPDSYLFFTQVAVNKVTEDQTEVPAWGPSAYGMGVPLSAHGQAIDALSLAISQQDGFLQATADDLEALDLQVQNPTTGLNARAKQTDHTALKIRVDTVGGGIETIANALTTVTASLDKITPNIYPSPSGEEGLAGWQVVGGTSGTIAVTDAGTGTRFRIVPSGAGVCRVVGPMVDVNSGSYYTAAMTIHRANGGAGNTFRMSIYWYDSAGSYISSTPITWIPAGTAWTRYSSTGQAPANAASCRVNMQREAGGGSGDGSGFDYIYFNMVKLEQGSVPTAFSNDKSIGNLSNATTANAQAASELDARVTSAEGQITAVASDVSDIGVQVGEQSASITQVAKVAATSGGSALVIPNPGFEDDFGWGALNDAIPDPSPALDSQSYYVGTSPHSGSRVMRFGDGPSAGVGGNRYNTTGKIPIDSSKRHRLVGWSRATQGPTSGYEYWQLRWYDAAGAFISAENNSRNFNGSHGWERRVSPWYTPPANAAFVKILIGVNGPVASLYLYYDDISVEVETTTTEAFNASYTLAMNAGGKFSGVKYGNDGTVSNAEFLFDNFDFITADGSFQITGGRTITRSNGYMTVVGKVFGQTNEFVEWYGPNQTNLNNCTRANAISYKTNSGITFSRGGFIGGTRVTSGFNPSLAVPVTFNSGVFGTGGANIAVNGTYSYYKRDTTNSLNGRFTPGSGTTSASIQLWRKIGTGAWAMVASQTATGGLEILSTGDTSDYAIWQINGAINYIDTAGGTANREYELRLMSRSLQQAVHNGQGTVSIDQQEQSTGIGTIE